MNPYLRATTRWLAAGVGAAAAAYGAYVGTTWYRYGDAEPPIPEEKDTLLDRFIPDYEVVERHHIRIAAPAAITLATAREVDLQSSGLVRTIIESTRADSRRYAGRSAAPAWAPRGSAVARLGCAG